MPCKNLQSVTGPTDDYCIGKSLSLEKLLNYREISRFNQCNPGFNAKENEKTVF